MLAKYERQELIGSGTFGNVYLVRSKADGQSYVSKEVKLNNMTNNEIHQALTEVSILSRCKHKNIIRYKEAIIDDHVKGTLAIVMEYAEYGDMYAAIKKRKGVYFPEHDVLGWFVQITLALQYIHNHNILHRDLKTQNIFLAGNKMIKIGDFGIARILKDHELATTAIGTPYYISPEICQRKPYNYKSDIWALGCVLFETAALVHPFQGLNFQQLVISILKAQYKSLPKHCSALIQDLVNILLNADPESRPSTNEILAIPNLQSHLYRYLNTFSTPESLGVIDVIAVASLKKNSCRRFSSGDILAVPRPPVALKRTASDCEDVKNLMAKMSPIKEMENCHVSFPPSQPSKKRTSDQEAYINEKVKINSRKPRKSIHSYSELSDTPSPKSTMRQTYGILKKAVERGEKAFNKIGGKIFKEIGESSQKCMSANETDCGYQSGPTSVRVVSSESEIDKVRKKSQTVASFCEQPRSTSHVPKKAVTNSPISVSDGDDDVFVVEFAQKPYSALNIRCPHSSQCQNCILDTLWKNRIKSTGDINDAEKLRLKRILQSVLGKKKFEEIYQILSEEWNDHYQDRNSSLQPILHSLNCEQKQYVPLLLQLLQLDVIKSLPV